MTTRQTAPLLIPLLQQEQLPTSTDLRAIQTWGKTVPVLLNNGPSVGFLPGGNAQLGYVYDTVVQETDSSGDMTLVFETLYGFNFSWGYNPYCVPGDVVATLTATVPVLSASSKEQLVIRCYSGTTPITLTSVRVNIFLVGA